MRAALGSEYLQWVKTRKPGRLNLAASGVLPCALSDLDLSRDDIEINGPGLYGFAPLQEAISEHCRVPVEDVVGASGTSTANFIAMGVLIEPGDEVLIEHPVYEPILAVARYFGASVKRFPRNGRIGDFATDRTRLIVITNLHNPSCSYLGERDIDEISETALRKGARVLVDEVYLECFYGQQSSAVHRGSHVVCTGSLTKAYGVGGLRCGWILADPVLARRMWHFKDLIDASAPHPAERLSLAAFRSLPRLELRARALLGRNRQLLSTFLKTCPQLQVELPQYGTCVFPRLKGGNGDRFVELLHEEFETDVVPGRFFEMPDHFRLGIGGETAAFAEGLDRLRRALEIGL